MPRPQQRLIRPCPECGKSVGFVTLRKWERPNYKKRLDYETGQKYTDFGSPIMKKTLPYEKGPIPEEVKSTMHDAMLSANKEILFWETVKYILEEKDFVKTYPEIVENAVYYGRGMQVATNLIKSLRLNDKRSYLHFVDLLNISLLIRNHSYREVAKKFGVSIKFIKNKESQVLQQAEAICNYMPGYIEFRKRIYQILETDRELREKFMKYAEGVMQNLVENNAEDITVRERVNQIRNEINDSKRENEYYYIIHPKSSGDRNVHLSRRIACGPFTEGNLPQDLLLDYWEKKKTKNKINK